MSTRSFRPYTASGVALLVGGLIVMWLLSGQDPAFGVFGGLGLFAYVAAMNATAVAVIDTATLKVSKMIQAGRQPWGLLVFPARSMNP